MYTRTVLTVVNAPGSWVLISSFDHKAEVGIKNRVMKQDSEICDPCILNKLTMLYTDLHQCW